MKEKLKYLGPIVAPLALYAAACSSDGSPKEQPKFEDGVPVVANEQPDSAVYAPTITRETPQATPQPTEQPEKETSLHPEFTKEKVTTEDGSCLIKVSQTTENAVFKYDLACDFPIEWILEHDAYKTFLPAQISPGALLRISENIEGAISAERILSGNPDNADKIYRASEVLIGAYEGDDLSLEKFLLSYLASIEHEISPQKFEQHSKVYIESPLFWGNKYDLPQ